MLEKPATYANSRRRTFDRVHILLLRNTCALALSSSLHIALGSDSRQQMLRALCFIPHLIPTRFSAMSSSLSLLHAVTSSCRRLSVGSSLWLQCMSLPHNSQCIQSYFSFRCYISFLVSFCSWQFYVLRCHLGFLIHPHPSNCIPLRSLQRGLSVPFSTTYRKRAVAGQRILR